MAKLTKEAQAERTLAMVGLRKGGASYRDIARMYGVSEKCVQRSLKASGQMEKPPAYYRLKPKQRKLVDGVAEGLTAREAALEAGYSPATARSAGTDLIGRQPEVKRALAEVMHAAASVELVAQRTREGIDAERTEFFACKGRVVSKRTVIDLGMRHRYIELWGKFTGALKDGMDVTVPVQIILDL